MLGLSCEGLCYNLNIYPLISWTKAFCFNSINPPCASSTSRFVAESTQLSPWISAILISSAWLRDSSAPCFISTEPAFATSFAHLPRADIPCLQSELLMTPSWKVGKGPKQKCYLSLLTHLQSFSLSHQYGFYVVFVIWLWEVSDAAVLEIIALLHCLQITEVARANLAFCISCLTVAVGRLSVTLGYACVGFKLLSELVRTPGHGSLSLSIYWLNSMSWAIWGL